MTPSVKRGLQVAKDLLRREIIGGNGPEAPASDADMLAAITWISRQEAIDAKRRGPRRLNPPGSEMTRSRS